jgi:hypothetical protein
VAEEEDGE